jgi:hypothetical protein
MSAVKGVLVVYTSIGCINACVGVKRIMQRGYKESRKESDLCSKMGCVLVVGVMPSVLWFGCSVVWPVFIPLLLKKD